LKVSAKADRFLRAARGPLAWACGAVVLGAASALMFLIVLRPASDAGEQISWPGRTPTTTMAARRGRPAPAPERLFARDSVWNRPLANDAAIDPASATLVKTLRDTGAQTEAWIGSGGTTTF
jgi:hypothetical protein